MSGAGRVTDPPEFYETGAHEHLRPQTGDRYATRIAAALAAQVGLRSTDHVLELGAGFGRFTFALLDRCASVTALDISPRMLGELTRARDARGISDARCHVVNADANAVDAALLERPVQAVVGFFFLHHLHDYRRTIAALVDCPKHYFPTLRVSTRRARSIFARISSASFVHANCVGVAL